MFDTDFESSERLMRMRVADELQQAELRSLQREARKAHQGWLSRQRGRVLLQLSRLLTSLGRRLEMAGQKEEASSVGRA